MEQTALALLLESQDHRVLLQLRDDKPTIYFPNHWSLFTGELMEGDFAGGKNFREALEYGIRRKIGEELSVRALGNEIPFAPDSLTLIHEGRYGDSTQNCRQYVFTAPLANPLEELVLHEGQRVGMFRKEELAPLRIAANYREIILEYFARATPSPASP